MNIVALLLVSVVAQDHWPAFLGAGASPQDEGRLPLTWSPSQNIAWSVTTPGHGQSSPVIWNGRILLPPWKARARKPVMCCAWTLGRAASCGATPFGQVIRLRIVSM